jgi:hypothetical protein
MASIATLLVGCPPPPKEYRLYNNSGVDIMVPNDSKRLVIASGTLEKITAVSLYAKSVETNDGRMWCYDVSSLPLYAGRPYLKTKAGLELSNHFTLQLESDGKLYILSNLSSLPSTALALQPDGFPLSPKTETCA